MLRFPLWLMMTTSVGVTVTPQDTLWQQGAHDLNEALVCSQQTRLEKRLMQEAQQGETYDLSRSGEWMTPYLSAGPEADLRRAFERGQYAKVRALGRTKAASSLPALYLHALSAFYLKDWKTSAEEFRVLAQDYVPMRDFSSWFAAKALENLKRFDEAAEVFLQVSEHSPSYAEAQLDAARCLALTATPRRALETYEALLERTTAAQHRLVALREAGELALRQKWKDEAKAYHLRLWSEFPSSADAKKLERRWKPKDIPVSFRLARVDTWVRQFRYDQARAEAKRLTAQQPLPSGPGCEAQWLIGKTLRFERRHDEAIPVLQQVVEQCTAADIRGKALFLLGSSQSIVDKGASRKTYETFAKENPDHLLTDDALYFAADLAWKEQDSDSALRLLHDIVDRFPESDFALTAAFRRFWWFYGKKEWAQALSSLAAYEDFVVPAEHAPLRAQARYWKARVFQQQGKMDEALSLFEEVVSKHPATLYASWAQRFLSKPARARSQDYEGNAEAGFRELMRDARFATAMELLRLQMKGARGLFSSVSLEGKSEDAVYAFVLMMGELGFDDAFVNMPERTLRAVLYGPLNRNTETVFRAHRPRTMEFMLGTEAARSGVELPLIQGIVHRESGFNPKAQSPVGAIGLMQIMPDTARLLAKKLSSPAPSLHDLRQANVNARLGAFYLGDLIRRFDGKVELAVAAYNAGPSRVQRWWQEGAFSDVDEFVENIPIKETRNYVKDVLADRAAYRLLRYRTAVSSSRTSRHGG